MKPVQASPYSFKMNTDTILIISPVIRLIDEKSRWNLLNKNNPSNAPYVNDAIWRPTIITAESLSSNNSAILIKTVPQAKLTKREKVTSTLFSNQSVTVDDANEFIDELSVDIAADRTPASKIPRIPLEDN